MHIAEGDLALTRRILAKHVPDGVAVMVYGARAHGRGLKPFSDLDLCLDAGAWSLPEGLITKLKQAFQDSDLPFVVDVIDRHAADAEFLKAIEPDLVPFP